MDRNYEGYNDLREELNRKNNLYGCDSEKVVEIVNWIMEQTSIYLSEYKTSFGGRYKFGLSSPAYIDAAKNMPASFDGRLKGAPFSVHTSGKNGITPTEVLSSFASRLDYDGNRCNGNVVDIILSPGLVREHLHAVCNLIRGAIKAGVYQMQFNVVDSKILIRAIKEPEFYPRLVVRVWGFSAYFNDLPDEYKQVLIGRALESEKVS